MTQLPDITPWREDLLAATDFATRIEFGGITEADAPQIIAEAAQLRGVEVPDPSSDEYTQLLNEVRLIGELERDELYGYGT